MNIISNKEMYKKKSLISNKPFFFKLDEIEGFDIDTMADFKIAEFLHKKTSNEKKGFSYRWCRFYWSTSG